MARTTAGRKKSSVKSRKSLDDRGLGIVIYVHGVGAHPPSRELKLEWDLALFGREIPTSLLIEHRKDLDHLRGALEVERRGLACHRVREVCPEFPGHPGYLHWSIPDPAAAGGSDQDTYPAFEQMAAELETRIGFWLAAIGAAPAPASVQEA